MNDDKDTPDTPRCSSIGAASPAPASTAWRRSTGRGRHNHAWAQAAQKKPLVIGLTMDASGQYAASAAATSAWAR